jgi:hypothetical protein
VKFLLLPAHHGSGKLKLLREAVKSKHAATLQTESKPCSRKEGEKRRS